MSGTRALLGPSDFTSSGKKYQQTWAVSYSPVGFIHITYLVCTSACMPACARVSVCMWVCMCMCVFCRYVYMCRGHRYTSGIVTLVPPVMYLFVYMFMYLFIYLLRRKGLLLPWKSPCSSHWLTRDLQGFICLLPLGYWDYKRCHHAHLFNYWY